MVTEELISEKFCFHEGALLSELSFKDNNKHNYLNLPLCFLKIFEVFFLILKIVHNCHGVQNPFPGNTRVDLRNVYFD